MSGLAQALGFGTYDRVLIPHQDDVGMCHGANQAFLDVCRAGFVTCGSVMVPCPWFPEIAEAAGAAPALDLGVHLTLTSEWRRYRWRPITGASRGSGLVDEQGYFWPSVLELRRHVVPEAAEAEMRAQIEAALTAGIDVTHIDTHMGAAFAPELVEIYVRLGRDYRLPVLLVRDTASYLGVLRLGEVTPDYYGGLIAAESFPPVDAFRMTPQAPSEQAEACYKALVGGIPPGVTFLSLHCNTDEDIGSVVPPKMYWVQPRVDEWRLFADPSFAAWARGQGIHLVGYRAIRDRMRAMHGETTP